MIDYEALRDEASRSLDWEIAHCGNGIDVTIKALQDYMKDKIVLDIEEVRAAAGQGVGCELFLHYGEPCEEIPSELGFENDPLCRLCKKLTEAAKAEEATDDVQ